MNRPAHRSRWHPPSASRAPLPVTPTFCQPRTTHSLNASAGLCLCAQQPRTVLVLPRHAASSAGTPSSPHRGGKHGGIQVCPSDPFQQRGSGGTIQNVPSLLPLFHARSAFTTQPSNVGRSSRGSHRSTTLDFASATTLQSPSHPGDPGCSKSPSGSMFRHPGWHATSSGGLAPARRSYPAAILSMP
ncbi:hypothetical protein NDU88_003361 [Pleurodeles waltl]|uniref:Uncharacterized protein n=1 Tax=Pleurodeles waltl TaxID=8319 RepID=A0AAV7WTE8_PLEWA|nr:hypothetical protein NDU88_003361 [Pleurodeles waltl]